MNFKSDTKEKFHEIHLLEANITANMTAGLKEMLYRFLEKKPCNVVLSLAKTSQIDKEAAEALTAIQTYFYDRGASMVLCEWQESVEEQLDNWGILETMNTAPTLSEAWDIVQMEEIERELLGDWE